MLIINSEDINKIGGDTAVALGTFDGVHIGHKCLIDTLMHNAGGLKTVVYSFENIPANVFSNKKAGQLTTVEEKQAEIDSCGADFLLLEKFTKETADESCEEFMSFLFDKLNAKLVVVGFNYTFGKCARGDAKMLFEEGKKRGVEVIIESPVEIDGLAVSSTGIRKAISEGSVELAAKHLGRYYSITGEVVSGNHIGRKLGFPTINFDIPCEKAVPKYGVYATTVNIDGRDYISMTNIGVRPTVDAQRRAVIETYIHDYSGNLYGRVLTVKFVSHIRDEKAFGGIDELQAQLKTDIERVKKILYKL